MRFPFRKIFEYAKILFIVAVFVYLVLLIQQYEIAQDIALILAVLVLIGFVFKNVNLKWKLIFVGRKIRAWSHKHVLLLFTISILISLINAASITLNFMGDGMKPPTPKICTQAEIEQASKSVVIIEGKKATGSGFWIDADTVLTNNHVVDHNPNLLVNKTLPVKVIATDSLRDIAILRVVDASQPSPLAFVDSSPNLADDVYVIGYPLDKNLSITKGIISAFPSDDYDDRNYIQTDAPISFGNSGGPLVDRCGRVVGMNTQVLSGAQSVGYAIAWDQLTQRINEMTQANKNATPQELEQTYPSEQAEVVAKYYTTLGSGDLEGAYSFFSTARKAKLPFDNWKIGLAKTYFIRLVSVSLSSTPNTINAHFYAAEFTDDYGWDYKVGEFEGTWTLVRENGLLKMNESNIKDITKPVATPTAE